MALDKQAFMKAAFDALSKYVDKYNIDNEAEVDISMDSDTGTIEIDGGNKHGAYALELNDL